MHMLWEETAHLHECEVLLPPNVPGVHGDEVVRIHDCVDSAVEHHSHVDITVVANIGVDPIEKKYCGVVVHMKERELLPLATQNDDDGVDEVKDLGQVEEPEEGTQGRLRCIKGLTR